MFLKWCLFMLFVFYISDNQCIVSDLQTCCLMHVLRVPDIARQA